MKKAFVNLFLIIYICSTVLSYALIPKEDMGKGLTAVLSEQKSQLNPTSFGIMCINAAYPTAEIETAYFVNENDYDEESGGSARGSETEDSAVTLKEGGADNSDKKKKAAEDEKSSESDVKVIVNDTDDAEPRVFGKDPVVLIVHTHATESYLPSSEGNYHRKGKLNTVRDVGEVLAKTLDEEGVPCVHDMTLHDEKSYNQAYSRSYETTEKLLKKYPSIECVIDLHRDAIPGENTAATVSISGKSCAKYSYVVSNAVETYESNLNFIKKMNKTATKSYGGFTGAVTERGYRYNQNLSSKYMLLEIGYNRNDIEDVRNSAEIFGRILAETLKNS